MNRQSCNLSNEIGAYFLEVALVFGLLTFIVFGIIDLGRYLQRSQMTLSLSNELAKTVARDCFDVCYPPNALSDNPVSLRSYQCLERKFNAIKSVAASIDPSTKVRLRYYFRRIEPSAGGNGFCEPVNPATATDSGWDSAQISEFEDFHFFVPGRIGENDVLGLKPYIIIAELRTNFQPIFPFMRVFFQKGAIYNATTI